MDRLPGTLYDLEEICFSLHEIHAHRGISQQLCPVNQVVFLIPYFEVVKVDFNDFKPVKNQGL